MRRVALFLAALVVATCGGAPPSPPPAGTPTSRPSVSPTHTPIPTPAVTATPEPTPGPSLTPVPSAGPSLAQLIGQKLMIRIEGTSASAALLGRIRRGEIGGVVLFGANIRDDAQLRALVTSLQRAATDGGQPPLIVSVDQEGGSIKRLRDAPPTLTLAEMAADPSGELARGQGIATGKALTALGITMDLAPVADVPASSSSLIALQGRTWSRDPELTAVLATSFAQGLQQGGVVPVMKHFPGIGLATANTDEVAVVIDAPATALVPGLRPYRAAVSAGLPAVMLSNATYPAYDPKHGAGWSRPIASGLLRDTLAFAGVSITDALGAAAETRESTTLRVALLACRAGVDVLLVTDPEAESAAVYAGLLAAGEAGDLDLADLAASYERIVALKGQSAGS